MASSNIEWTDQTWNPVVGCTPVSPGCLNCYAATMARRLEAMGKAEYQPRDVGGDPRSISQIQREENVGFARAHNIQKGKSVRIAEVKAGRAVFTGDVRTVPDRLTDPFGWKKPRIVFGNSMSDLFHEDVPFEFIAAVYGIALHCQRHTFQILTKRPERAAAFYVWIQGHADAHYTSMVGALTHYAQRLCRNPKDPGECHPVLSRGLDAVLATPWPLPNVWLGTSVEDQARAAERIPHLLTCRAAVRFLSVEPLIGAVDLTQIALGDGNVGDCLKHKATDIWSNTGNRSRNWGRIHWVIVGGESGTHARPCNVAWIESIVEQCRDARVPVFVKQLGQKPVAPYYMDDDGAEEWQSLGQQWEPLGWDYRDGQPPSGTLTGLRLSSRKGGDPSEWPEHLRVREWPGERKSPNPESAG